VTGWWFSLGTPVSSTNKPDRHNITDILFIDINSLTKKQITGFIGIIVLLIPERLYLYSQQKI
jgi:hypothetical protein